jgi:hypothetical protein
VQFDYVICHEPEHAERIQPAPKTVCLVPRPNFTPCAEESQDLRAGVVVDNVVSQTATLMLAQRLADDSAIAQVLIRRHPGASEVDWPSLTHPKIAYSNSRVDLTSFAETIDFIVASNTTAAIALRSIGVPCLRWPHFYWGMPQDFGEIDSPIALGDDVLADVRAARGGTSQREARECHSGEHCGIGSRGIALEVLVERLQTALNE